MARVSGVAELHRLAANAREAGRKDIANDIYKELYSRMYRAVRPFEDVVRDLLPDHTPSGYTDDVQSSLKLKPMVRARGIRVIGTAIGRSHKRHLSELDAGGLRHPFFGNRNRWYSQAVEPGFFTGPEQKDALIDPIKNELRKVLKEVGEEVKQIIGKGL